MDLNAQAIADSLQPEATMNVFSIAAKGGPLMIVLLLISFIAIVIIIERWLRFSAAKKGLGTLSGEILDLVKADQIERAIVVADSNPESPIASVLSRGLKSLELGIETTKQTMHTAADVEIHMLEKNLGTLSTFAAVAPLIGFLGTVTGMVNVFMKIQTTGGGVDISLLAGGIWEALITTIGGLTVGILAIMLHNFFIGKIESINSLMEDTINEFIILIGKAK